ncbi:MAG: hypothetical protein WCD79_04860 [Chthoniobacteraceae bacterium]
MNTTQYFENANWLISEIGSEIPQALFTTSVVHQLLQTQNSAAPQNRTEFLQKTLKATHEFASIQQSILKNDNAKKILIAFNLSSLLDENFSLNFASNVVTLSGGGEKAAQEQFQNFHVSVSTIATNWQTLSNSLGPLQAAILPANVLNDRTNDTVLILEIRQEGTAMPNAASLATIFESINTLYQSVMRAIQAESAPGLEIVYITSGSTVRIDLKGIGDAVKYVKELFIEGWEKIRHRKADDFHHNAKATLDGLHTLKVLQEHRSLNPEEKERIKHHVLESMIDLYKEGALPQEIQPVELISNDKLITSVKQRLLLPIPASPPSISTSSEDSPPSSEAETVTHLPVVTKKTRTPSHPKSKKKSAKKR